MKLISVLCNALFCLNRSPDAPPTTGPTGSTLPLQGRSAPSFLEPHAQNLNHRQWSCRQRTTIGASTLFGSRRKEGGDRHTTPKRKQRRINKKGGNFPADMQYNKMIKDSRSWNEVQLIVEEMEANNIEPSVYTYSARINACTRFGEAQNAVNLLNEMNATGISPNEFCYSAAVKASQSWRGVELILDMMRTEKAHHSEVTYGALIDACASNKTVA